MQKPIIVHIVYDYHNGDKDSEIYLYLNMQNAKEHGKKLAKDYLKDNGLTVNDFQGKWDEFYEEEGDSSYTFHTWSEKTNTKYNVDVYRKGYEDACQ